MKKLLLSTILITTSLFSNACDDIKFNVGSIKVMDRLIDECEQDTKMLEDTLVVNRLVDVYSNTLKTKRNISNSILKYSYRYNINPVTLTALLAKESSMRSDVSHSEVFVKIPTSKYWKTYKSARVQAVGMGGVIFEIWKYELKDIGIYSRKSLYNIENNIKASAYILSIYTHERKQLKHTATKEESALLRYYGVIRNNKGIPNKTYSTAVYKIKNSIKG